MINSLPMLSNSKHLKSTFKSWDNRDFSCRWDKEVKFKETIRGPR